MLLHARAAFVGAKAGDAGRQVYTFRATSAVVDRQGEIVTADGWKTDNYAANPVVLDSHNYGSIDAILGRAVALRDTGDGLEVDVMFAQTDAGRRAEALVADGMLNAVSVGFQTLERQRGAKPGDPVRHTKKDLMEISMVPIPANPEALRLRSIVAKAADFDTTLALAERLSEHRARRWRIESALADANAAALADSKLSDEGKLAAIDANLGQYHAAMLDWYAGALALGAEASAEGMDFYLFAAEPDVTKGGERLNTHQMWSAEAVEPDEVKAGRKLSGESMKRIRSHADAMKACADDLHKMCDECDAAGMHEDGTPKAGEPDEAKAAAPADDDVSPAAAPDEPGEQPAPPNPTFTADLTAFRAFLGRGKQAAG